METLPLSAYQAAHPAFEEDLYQAIDLLNCVSRRTVEGGPAPEAVRAQIAWTRAQLAEIKEQNENLKIQIQQIAVVIKGHHAGRAVNGFVGAFNAGFCGENFV